MALVPVANGVDNVVAAEGIRVVDTGGNLFKIGLNVGTELTLVGDLLAGAIAPGLLQQNLGDAFNPTYEGEYIVRVRCFLGLGPGAIVAGPDDRFCILLQEVVSGDIVSSVQIPIYNRAAGDAVPQLFNAIAKADISYANQYQAILSMYNPSGTLSIPAGELAFSLSPLCSTLPVAAPAA